MDICCTKNQQMNIINFEFKAVANNLEHLERKLQELNPVFKGEDHQVDTYFNVSKGRLKMREGNIENSLIYYERPDTANAKQSDVLLYEHTNSSILKDILIKLHGIKVVVDKTRRIYFIDNVKFHFDRVKDLGTFVEVEAQSDAADADINHLQAQCNQYFQLFELNTSDYLHVSYSDLLLDFGKVK